MSLSLCSKNKTGRFTKEEVSSFLFLEKYKGVFALIDNTGKMFYAKKCNATEYAQTHALQRFILPDDAVLKLPKMSLKPEDLPSEIYDYISSHKTGESIIVVDAFPKKAKLIQENADNILRALDGKPVNKTDIDTLLRDVALLNKAGILHMDYLSNMFVCRGHDGRVEFHTIDYEAGFSPIYPNRYEDVAHLEYLYSQWGEKGLISDLSFPRNCSPTLGASVALWLKNIEEILGNGSQLLGK